MSAFYHFFFIFLIDSFFLFLRVILFIFRILLCWFLLWFFFHLDHKDQSVRQLPLRAEPVLAGPGSAAAALPVRPQLRSC